MRRKANPGTRPVIVRVTAGKANPAGQSFGVVDAVSVIQSGFSAQAAASQPPIGNLELIARAGSRLAAYWRDDGPASPGDPPDR